MNSITRSITLIAILLITLSACAPIPTALPPTPTSTPLAVPGGKYVIGYYPSWVAERNVFVKDIPARKLTHINYAFSQCL